MDNTADQSYRHADYHNYERFTHFLFDVVVILLRFFIFLINNVLSGAIWITSVLCGAIVTRTWSIVLTSTVWISITISFQISLMRLVVGVILVYALADRSYNQDGKEHHLINKFDYFRILN